jgi:hypothetical protein
VFRHSEGIKYITDSEIRSKITELENLCVLPTDFKIAPQFLGSHRNHPYTFENDTCRERGRKNSNKAKFCFLNIRLLLPTS